MSYFDEYSSLTVKISLIICLFIYFFYFIDKWKRTKLIFSPFNFQIIFFCFVLFVISPYQYNYLIANTWSSISVGEYIDKLNEAYFINLLGFSILGLTMMYYEKRHRNSKFFCRLMSFTYANSRFKLVDLFCMAIGLVFVVYIVIKTGGIPIFNGKRFSTNSAQFIYLLLNAMVYCCAWYCVGGLLNKSIKNVIILALLGFALLITGNRTPILKIMYAGFILLVSFEGRINYKTIFKQAKYVIVILMIGIVIIAARNGSDIVSFADIIMNYIVYGSTFCDVRDGARVLFGYHNMYTSPLWGKTYLASLLSFVPSSVQGIPILSSIAEFRQIYSGGTWSTKTLFGISNHYGLRGGMFLPSYTNFGILGIIVIAFILGCWFANCEILFRRLLKNKGKFDLKRIMFSYCFVSMLFELLYAPATFNSFWGYLGVLLLFSFARGKIYTNSKAIEVCDE